jgi:hypothetical protein
MQPLQPQLKKAPRVRRRRRRCLGCRCRIGTWYTDVYCEPCLDILYTRLAQLLVHPPGLRGSDLTLADLLKPYRWRWRHARSERTAPITLKCRRMV